MLDSLLFGMRRGVRLWLTIFMVGSLAFTTACNDDDDDNNTPPTPVTTYGDAVAVGNGTARSFITVDASGNPTEIGMRLTEAALTGLPATDTTPPAWYMLSLPANSTAKLPFNHLSLDWNPNGHEPAAVYGKPHFDAHFYMITMAERAQIGLDDANGDVLPAANLLPAGYQTAPNVAPGRTVPMMGRHWIDPNSHEYHGEDFTQTFIYGSYNGKVIFLEPMITKAYLEEKKTETFTLPRPEMVERTGLYYPTKYTIGYDAATKEYVIKLHDMELR